MKALDVHLGHVILKPLVRRVCEQCLEAPATKLMHIRIRIASIPKEVEILCCKPCSKLVFDALAAEQGMETLGG